ncbi:hypothetical protein HA052_20945 [Chromobacterium haemolyticum]|uniref:Uncharacterized protein n=1 Tax=Chromobacterium fluminis TaxID=3044269 RepID=A0ABX0L775_9NEIS|nr:hypothetical protein [Chromobacterium haemolyticum]NHR07659.1 hypothetical protein [Chromobacterium haemolyticum]
MSKPSQPFARALAFSQALTAIINLPLALRIAKLAELGSYQSQGKGKGRFTGKFSAKRMRNSNKAFEHACGCGPREVARRRRQIERGMLQVSPV